MTGSTSRRGLSFCPVSPVVGFPENTRLFGLFITDACLISALEAGEA